MCPRRGLFSEYLGSLGGTSLALAQLCWLVIGPQPRGAALLMLIVFPKKEGQEVPKSCGGVDKINSFSMCFTPHRIT